jgi:hypothetical protein
MFFARNEATPSVQTANEAKLSSAPSAKPMAPSETPVLTRADEARQAGTTRAPAEVAQAEREKDSLSIVRQKAEAQNERAFTLNAPAPQPAVGVGGSPAVAKQKEELVNTPTTAAPPLTTPPPESSLLQRRYGLAAPAQASSSSAVSTVSAALAASSPPPSRDEAANTALAYKSLSQSTGAAAPARGVQLKSAADDAKRRPAPMARASQQYVQSELLKKNAELELADKSTVAKPVLASFELEQIGHEVRIVDSDGSVYSGSFQSPQAFSYLDSSVTQRAGAARSLQPAQAQSEKKSALYDSRLQADFGYFFTVTGTNQSLNQKIVFTGQILAPTNTANRVALPELNPQLFLNSRILGRAVIGTNKEVEVNAVPAH